MMKKKRLLSSLLAIVMVLSLCPAVTIPASAASGTYNIDNGTLGAVTLGDNETATFTGTYLHWHRGGQTRIVVNGRDAHIILQNMTAELADADDVGNPHAYPFIDASGASGTLTIELQGENKIVAAANHAAVRGSNGVVIKFTGTGSLDCTGGSTAPAIGGNACNVEFAGGTVKATGGVRSAGVGSGTAASMLYQSFANISVTGGTLTATGGPGADGYAGGAGVGMGSSTNSSSYAGNVSVSSGTLTATGADGGAGIGGGFGNESANDRNLRGTVTVTGGTVTATGADGGAGIGGSRGQGWTQGYTEGGSGWFVNISGGEVTATGSGSGAQGAAGIGGGCGTNNSWAGETGVVNISGGTVKATGGSGSGGVGGAGIGSGGYNDESTRGRPCNSEIIISGNAVVNATGGGNTVGIGAGTSRVCGPIHIYGGSVTVTGPASGGPAIGSAPGGSLKPRTLDNTQDRDYYIYLHDGTLTATGTGDYPAVNGNVVQEGGTLRATGSGSKPAISVTMTKRGGVSYITGGDSAPYAADGRYLQRGGTSYIWSKNGTASDGTLILSGVAYITSGPSGGGSVRLNLDSTTLEDPEADTPVVYLYGTNVSSNRCGLAYTTNTRPTDPSSPTSADYANATAKLYGVRNGLEIPSGMKLTVAAGETLTVEKDARVVMNGTLDCKGTLSIAQGGTYENRGQLQCTGEIVNAGTLLNRGTLTAAKVTNGGTITNESTFTTSGILTNTSTLTNTGTMTNGGTLTNTGALVNNGGGTFHNNTALTNGGTLTNAGTLNNASTITNTGSISNSGAINNTGTIQNESGSGFSGNTPSGGGSFNQPPAGKPMVYLKEGETYYFDLSFASYISNINTSLPGGALQYVPFTYAGTLNSYNYANLDAAKSAGKTAYDNKKWTPDLSPRSLFIAQQPVGTIDNANAFGSGYDFLGSYKLRAPSGGLRVNNVGCRIQRGPTKVFSIYEGNVSPAENEWDLIGKKGYITTTERILTSDYPYDFIYGPENPDVDISTLKGKPQSYDGYALYRQNGSSPDYSTSVTTGTILISDYEMHWKSSYPIVETTGTFLPVLEVNPNLSSTALRTVTLHLNGATLAGKGEIKIVSGGDGFSAPTKEGWTLPTGATELFWNTSADGSGQTYAPGDKVPFGTDDLYALWSKTPTPTAAVNYAGETLTGLNATSTAYFIDGRQVSATSGAVDITPYQGKTITVTARKSGSAASDAQTLTVPARPAAPIGITGGVYTLTGMTGMEYQAPNTSTWTKATTATVTGLHSGVYLVRKAATASSFASESVEVRVSTSVTNLITLTLPAGTSYPYTGSEVRPIVQAKANGVVVPTSEYTVTYSNNTAVGTATVTIKDLPGGAYGFDDTPSTTFTITKADSQLSGLTVKNGNTETNAFTYGDTITVEFTPEIKPAAANNALLAAPAVNQAALFLGDTQLTAPVNAGPGGKFTLTYDTTEQGIPIGAQSLTVKYGGNGNLNAGEQAAGVTLSARTLTADMLTIDANADLAYTGAEIRPGVTVAYHGKTLTQGTDYTAPTYTNNTDAGTAQLSVTGQGWYTGEAAKSFTITKGASQLSGLIVKNGNEETGSFTYGDTITVEFTPKVQPAANNALLMSVPATNQAALFLGNTQLTEPVTANESGKCTITYDTTAQDIPVGSAELTVRYGGGGNLNAGEESFTVTLSAKNVTPTATLSDESYVYDGTAKEPGVTLRDGGVVIDDSEYTVDYADNTDVGTATVTVTDNEGGYYEFEPVEATFAILKSDSDLPLTVKNDGRTTSTFAYGDTITVEFTPQPKAPANSVLGLEEPAEDQAALFYDGTQLTEPVTADENGKFTLSYDTTGQDIPVGGAELTVRYGGDDNLNAGEETASITLNARAIKPTVELDETSYVYDGEEHMPGVTVMDGRTVIDESEYSVTFPDDVTGAGTKTVTVTDAEDGFYDLTTATAQYTITRGASQLSGLTVTNDGVENSNFVYGDSITVTFTPQVQPPANNALLLTEPEENEAALFYGNAQLTEPVTADESGTCIITYDTMEQGIPVGSAELTVRYGGGGNLDTGEESFIVTLSAKSVRPTVSLSDDSYMYDGTAKEPGVTLTDGRTVIDDSEYTVEYADNTDVGTATVTVTDNAGGYYDLETVDATFEITKSESNLPLTVKNGNSTTNTFTYGDTITVEFTPEARPAANSVLGLDLPENMAALFYGDTQLAEPVEADNSGKFTLTYDTMGRDIPVGGATLTVRYGGDANLNAGEETANITLNARPLAAAMIGMASAMDYTGAAIEPEVTVTYRGETLVQGTDYTAPAYQNNVGFGKATATVTGTGWYVGSASAEFTIQAKALDVGNETVFADYAAISGTWSTSTGGVTFTTNEGWTVSTEIPVGGGTTVTFTDEGDGVKKTVYAKDSEGHPFRTELSYRLDVTKPAIGSATGNTPATWQKSALVEFDVTDATSGVASVTAKDPAGGSLTVTRTGGKYSFTAVASGAFTVTARDTAGNETVQTIEVTNVNSAAPTMTITPGISGDKWYGVTTFTAQATSSKAGATTVTVTFGGENIGNSTANGFTWTAEATGSYTVTMTDEAGNETVQTVTIKVEPTIDTFVTLVSGLSDSSDLAALMEAKTTYEAYTGTVRGRLAASDAAAAALGQLNGWLTAKAQDAANAVSSTINSASTIEAIHAAEQAYNALTADAKALVSAADENKLNALVRDASAAQNAVDQLTDAAATGATYEQKQAAIEFYGSLSAAQKTLAEAPTSANRSAVNDDLTAVDAVVAEIRAIRTPYTASTKAAISQAKQAYDALTEARQKLVPSDQKAALDALETQRGHAQAVETTIGALGDTPQDNSVMAAQAAYNALTANEKAMVGNTSALNTAYRTMMNSLAAESADKRAAAEFAVQVSAVTAAPTMSKIAALQTAYNRLSASVKTLVDNDSTTKTAYTTLGTNYTAAQTVINQLNTALAGGSTAVSSALEAYNGLNNTAQQALVEEATGGLAAELTAAKSAADSFQTALGQIPTHEAGQQNADGSPNLSQCSGHSYADHKAAIETARSAYEKLSDTARKLVSADDKAKLDREYASLLDYLDYISKAASARSTVEVVGLTDNVELPPDSAAAAKTVIAVTMEESQPAVRPTASTAAKSQALSVDIKLVAKMYDDVNATADAQADAVEQVQPAEGKTVVVSLKVPSGYKNETLEIWHVKENGARIRIYDFNLIEETDGTYVVFEVDSFSHFVLFAEAQPSGGGSTGGGGSGGSGGSSGGGSASGGSDVQASVQGVGGTVSASGNTVTITPDKGYQIKSVTVNGKVVEIPKDGKLTDLKATDKVVVTFEKIPGTSTVDMSKYTDLDAGAWYYEATAFVAERGLFYGTSESTFSPNSPMTRAMLMTVLARADGQDTTAPTGGKWYDVGMKWAMEQGISDGTNPDGNITREQLATMLYRYAGSPAVPNLLLDFTDAGELADYAQDAMRWAVSEGIVNGKGNGILDPKGNATRAQVAAMLMRYLQG